MEIVEWTPQVHEPSESKYSDLECECNISIEIKCEGDRKTFSWGWFNSFWNTVNDGTACQQHCIVIIRNQNIGAVGESHHRAFELIGGE